MFSKHIIKGRHLIVKTILRKKKTQKRFCRNQEDSICLDLSSNAFYTLVILNGVVGSWTYLKFMEDRVLYCLNRFIQCCNFIWGKHIVLITAENSVWQKSIIVGSWCEKTDIIYMVVRIIHHTEGSEDHTPYRRCIRAEIHSVPHSPKPWLCLHLKHPCTYNRRETLNDVSGQAVKHGKQTGGTFCELWQLLSD